jgi:pyridoxal phosphate enzyme (YggS family)
VAVSEPRAAASGSEARVRAGLSEVRARVAAACARAQRDPATVRLIAVSKRHPPEAERDAYAMGQREFGENYVQELVAKGMALTDLPDLQLRLIGHLQRNKVKELLKLGPALRSVDTLDSVRLAEALGREAEVAGRAAGRKLEVLVQVNPAGEAQKSGVAESDLPALLAAVRGIASLELKGLMLIPPNVDPEDRRPYFGRMRELAREFGVPELSMGMSDDIEPAIAEGATQVRVGTAIFGERS